MNSKFASQLILLKCWFSPRSSIQSNKVDSSGLNATPPHRDPDLDQLRGRTSPEDSGLEMDSSLDLSRTLEEKGSDEEEEEGEVEQKHVRKVVTNNKMSGIP